MADKITGVNPLLTHTTAKHELGCEVDDPRGGAFAGNRIKYVKANGTIAAGKAVKLDVAGTAGARDTEVVVTTATTPVAGIAHVAIASGSYGWITVSGNVDNVTVPDAAVAGTILGGGAAGALVDISTTPTAALNAAANGGRSVLLLEDTGTSLGSVFLS